MKRLPFFRVLPAGARGAWYGWHNYARLHIHLECAAGHCRVGGQVVEQHFDIADIPDFMVCAKCGGRFKQGNSILDIGPAARTAYCDKMSKRWYDAFTHEMESVAAAVLG